MREFRYESYSRRFDRPLRTARGEWAVREGYLLRIREGDRVGYGEVAPLPEFGTETLAEAEAYLVALPAGGEWELPEHLRCCAFGMSAALAGLKGAMALPDRNFEVAGLLPAGEGAESVLEEKRSGGYDVFKWKVGVEAAAREMAVFERLTDRLPKGGRLRLDANGAWSLELLGEWLEFLKGRVDVVEFVEQPLAPGLEAEMMAARAESGIEIALDESLNGAGAARWLGEWPGVLVVKAPLMGDMARLQAQLEPVAERVVLSSVFETGIGFLNTLVLAGALPKLNFALGFDTLQFSDALGGRKEGAVIAASDLVALNPEEIWNANRHLS